MGTTGYSTKQQHNEADKLRYKATVHYNLSTRSFHTLSRAFLTPRLDSEIIPTHSAIAKSQHTTTNFVLPSNSWRHDVFFHTAAVNSICLRAKTLMLGPGLRSTPRHQYGSTMLQSLRSFPVQRSAISVRGNLHFDQNGLKGQRHGEDSDGGQE